ncbi:MAG: T9SS type A sorting domain-containing protein, partial [Saprospiraceae bacterium]|nr:T9SS type A sorting domain-containing protein [Saprospiraceae bacterium]
PQPQVSYTDSLDLDLCGNGEIHRTWIAIDHAGNRDSCTQAIKIQDTTAPAVIVGTCPKDTLMSLDLFNDTDLGLPRYQDNCAGEYSVWVVNDTIGFNSLCNSGTIIRRFFAQDMCGNIDSSCQQLITLIASIDEIDKDGLPNDTIIFCGEPLPSTEIIFTYYSDYEISIDVEKQTTSCGELYIRTILLRDECVQYAHEQTIELIDTTPPVIELPSDTIISIGDSLPIFPFSISDDCSGTSSTFTDAIVPAMNGCDYSLQRIWTVMDDCGNTTIDTHIIHMVDIDPPAIQLDPAKWPDLDDGDTINIYGCDTMLLAINDLLILDQCTYEDSSFYQFIGFGNCDQDGTYALWKSGIVITDAAGNKSELSLAINQRDTTSPQLFNLPLDTVVTCSDSVPSMLDSIFAIDDCTASPDVQLQEITYYDPNDSSNYLLQRTWVAIDQCGNSSVHTQEIVHCNFDRDLLLSSLSGVIWLDQNHDGIRALSESMLDGIQIELYQDHNGELVFIDSIRSGADSIGSGTYHFSKLEAGQYKVKFIIPDSMYFTHKDIGDSHFDSDADLSSGETDHIQLNIAQHMRYKDAGILIQEEELPSEILYFEVSTDSCQINLEWATIQKELGNKILIEYSTDGVNYELLEIYSFEDSINTVATFSYLDEVSINRPIYRVRIVDESDKNVAIAVLLAETACYFDHSNVKLYPNPTTQDLTMEFIAGNPQVVEVKILDLLGRTVGNIDVKIRDSLQKEQIDLSMYPASTYIFLFHFEGKQYTREVIKF